MIDFKMKNKKYYFNIYFLKITITILLNNFKKANKEREISKFQTWSRSCETRDSKAHP
jgi:hypothetical protein